jgi:protein-S-isoprenylcysteine O-methyltransferase Ste14
LLGMAAVGFNHRTRSVFGSVFFLMLAVGHFFLQKNVNQFYTYFIAFRFLTVSFLYLIREPPKQQAVFSRQIVSWIGAFLPFGYSTNFHPIWVLDFDLSPLMFLGSFLSFWGILSLGKSFSIVPSNRTIVREGPYRWIKHPIYWGYIVSESALLISFPTFFNLFLWLVILNLYRVRAKWEEEILRI